MQFSVQLWDDNGDEMFEPTQEQLDYVAELIHNGVLSEDHS